MLKNLIFFQIIASLTRRRTDDLLIQLKTFLRPRADMSGVHYHMECAK